MLETPILEDYACFLMQLLDADIGISETTQMIRAYYFCRVAMRLLRFIWQDLRWLNSLRPAVKIAGLILGIALIFAAWYPGAEWWTTPRIFVLNKMAREAPPLETVGVFIDVIVIVYIVGLIDRDRRSR